MLKLCFYFFILALLAQQLVQSSSTKLEVAPERTFYYLTNTDPKYFHFSLDQDGKELSLNLDTETCDINVYISKGLENPTLDSKNLIKLKQSKSDQGCHSTSTISKDTLNNNNPEIVQLALKATSNSTKSASISVDLTSLGPAYTTTVAGLSLLIIILSILFLITLILMIFLVREKGETYKGFIPIYKDDDSDNDDSDEDDVEEKINHSENNLTQSSHISHSESSIESDRLENNLIDEDSNIKFEDKNIEEN
ncbi:hypothetical protein M0812_20268 [Anaeramoeba flamelloides]|uniref:Mid2 domain-containing protein n=1 Tax=Anaeramoeba flamelloides TaxID=1746091 RepID=A0AAV7YWG0_9EUKA|nr:hypothetical protein M0812_20268 [Anaeramoeba flamelloides]